MDSIALRYGDKSRIDYAWVSRVNRIFGPHDSIQPCTWDSDSHLLSATWSITERHQLQGFTYLLDLENGNGRLNSNATVGIEYSGKVGTVELTAAWARQAEYGDSPLSYNTPYYLFEAAYTRQTIGATLGLEVLGSDGGAAGSAHLLRRYTSFRVGQTCFLPHPRMASKTSTPA